MGHRSAVSTRKGGGFYGYKLDMAVCTAIDLPVRGGSALPAITIRADRLHPLIPRDTPRWTALYRGHAAVEREFGRLKNDWWPVTAPRARP